MKSTSLEWPPTLIRQSPRAHSMLSSCRCHHRRYDAVKSATDSGMPVFGLNSGNDIRLINFVAMNEYLGGSEAANEFLEQPSTAGDIVSGATSALFLNQAAGNSALTERYNGYSDTLSGGIDGINVEEKILTGIAADDSTVIDTSFDGCPYDFVLLGGSGSVNTVIQASVANGCTGKTLIGTFDADAAVIDAIMSGALLFSVSQNEYLQGALPIIMASVYSSTGMNLVRPSVFGGVHLSGPVIIKKDNVESRNSVCESMSFLVCGSNADIPTINIDGSCQCTDRTEVTIGVVHHGVTTDVFWDQVNTAIEQGAKDMDAKLRFRQFELQPSEVSLDLMMSEQIRQYCDEEVDAILVSIPSDTIRGNIEHCMGLDIPVAVFNSLIKAADMDLQYLGQSEYNGGLAAGIRMSKEATRFFCVNHAQGVTVVEERCAGFEAGLRSAGITNFTEIMLIQAMPRYTGKHLRQPLAKTGIGMALVCSLPDSPTLCRVSQS